MKAYLLIPHIRIHNANAMSSPYTVGFPAMTGWLGGVHALQRRLQATGWAEVFLQKLAVVCHQCDLQTYQGTGDYRESIVGTANPLKRSRKTGEFERPPLIEEARCHAEVSLLIETSGIQTDNKEAFLAVVREQLLRLKMAGGDIIAFQAPEIWFVDENEEKDVRILCRRLMPGYAMIERRDLLREGMLAGQDALDALLDYLKVSYTAEGNADGALRWNAQRKVPGWIVPIATGFKAISGAVQVQNQRDPDCTHYFAEAVVTLGEFKMPYHFDLIDDMMWEYHFDEANGLYVCVNQKLA